MNTEINVVIGSWGSYNACNERALGSKWLSFANYGEWREITEELKKQGFKLNGIDEELFVQDIEGLPSSCANWDFINPMKLFETLKESGVLDEPSKFNTLQAYLEVRNFADFERLVESNGDCWDGDIHVYEGYDWDDYGREMFENCGYQIDGHLLDYFDFAAYGESYSIGYAEKYSGGIIEICE